MLLPLAVRRLQTQYDPEFLHRFPEPALIGQRVAKREVRLHEARFAADEFLIFCDRFCGTAGRVQKLRPIVADL